MLLGLKNVLQFSLIDMRPLSMMAEACHKHNVKLLTYGTLVSTASGIACEISFLMKS